MNNENTVIYYRHCPVNKKKERLTICGVWSEKDGILRIGVSRCSKADEFTRIKGREISFGRASKTPIYSVKTDNPRATFTTIHNEINGAFREGGKEREKFLTFINQNPQTKEEKKLPPLARALTKIKEWWDEI